MVLDSITAASCFLEVPSSRIDVKEMYKDWHMNNNLDPILAELVSFIRTLINPAATRRPRPDSCQQ